VITVVGHKRAVELAKEIIVERGQKLADTVIISVSIPAKHHSKLIGKGGKVVGKLMELYNVFVKFPSKGHVNGTAGSEHGDAESDVGKAAVDEDKVTIRGFKGDVEKAKQELLALAAYEEKHSHSISFTVPSAVLAWVVGRKGQTVHLIKEETDTRIEFDRPKETGEDGEPQGDVTVIIEGPKAGCEEAKKKIMEIVDEQVRSKTDVVVGFRDSHLRFYSSTLPSDTLRSRGDSTVSSLAIRASPSATSLMSGRNLSAFLRSASRFDSPRTTAKRCSSAPLPRSSTRSSRFWKPRSRSTRPRCPRTTSRKARSGSTSRS
jgi:transcription antitermination factor NusA-like protein